MGKWTGSLVTVVSISEPGLFKPLKELVQEVVPARSTHLHSSGMPHVCSEEVLLVALTPRDASARGITVRQTVKRNHCSSALAGLSKGAGLGSNLMRTETGS